MLMEEYGVNWNNIKTVYKRGCCYIKQDTEISECVMRKKWVVDTEIPIFSQDREYIEKYILI